MNAAEEAIRASNHRIFSQWLMDPATAKFFAALRFHAVARLTAAAANSTRTGVENAKEHNLLVEANAYLKVIEKYARRENYPYAEYDDAQRATAIQPSSRGQDDPRKP